MNRESLYRSIEASQAYYARLFTPIHPTYEQVCAEKKQDIIGFYEGTMEIDLRLQVLEAEFGHKYNPDQPRVPAGSSGGGQWTSDGGGDAGDSSENAGAALLGLGTVYSTPGGIIYDDKIQGQMVQRGWTPEQIDTAQKYGNRIDAINYTNGEPYTPATRYVSPETGASVIIDNTTNEVVQVGEPDFMHNERTGDVLGAVMRPSPNIGPEGFNNPTGVEGGEGVPLHGGGASLGLPHNPAKDDMEE